LLLNSEKRLSITVSKQKLQHVKVPAFEKPAAKKAFEKAFEKRSKSVRKADAAFQNPSRRFQAELFSGDEREKFS
jgi:hypothetical protein